MPQRLQRDHPVSFVITQADGPLFYYHAGIIALSLIGTMDVVFGEIDR